MVAQLTHTPHPILAAVLAARADLVAVGDREPMYMTPKQQEATLRELAGLKAQTAALQLRILAASDDAAVLSGARDAGCWLSGLTLVDFADARAEVRLAEALDRRWSKVAAGMADGVVSAAQARVVVAALDALPDDLDPELVIKAEEQMVAYCSDFRPKDLRRLGRHLLDVVAPEIAEAAEAKRLEDEEKRAREKCR